MLEMVLIKLILRARDSLESQNSYPTDCLAEKTAELDALKDELSDLKFYESTLKQVRKSSNADEINSGTIVMVESPSNTKTSRMR